MLNKIFLLLLALSLFGCATTSQPMYTVEYITVYEKVYSPIPCDVLERNRPILDKTKNIKELLNEIFLYVEYVEADLQYCRGIK